MYSPATRVLTILELLQSRHQMSGPELAMRLEVDARTIRRYITMLQDLGIPVEAERGRYGSYRLRPGFKLPPLMFTDEEAFALTIGLIAARKIGLEGAAPAVEGAFAKIERVLPLPVSERVQAVQETLIFDFTPYRVAPPNEMVIALCAAVQQERRVWLSYHPWSREASEREVDPYGLVYRSGYWYMVGYCHLRNALRIFRLDRVLQAELCDATFVRPLDFDSLAYVVQSLPQTPGRWSVRVLLKTTLEQAQQMISPTLATLEQADQGVLFCCYADNLDWIAHVLAGLDCPLVVRQPVELRAALRKLAQRVITMAEYTEEAASDQ